MDAGLAVNESMVRGPPFAQTFPFGIIVYTADPVAWEMVVLVIPDMHEEETAPPPLDEATARSYKGESKVNTPPVELDKVTITLVALTCSRSATDPVAIVSVVVGEVSEILSAVLKLSGAA